MLFAVLAAPAILTATINSHQIPTAESLGGQPGQAVACHIDRVAACKFKSLYQFENQGSPEASQKYPRTMPALAALTFSGRAAGLLGTLAEIANPFTWAAWAEYRLQGTGLAWTPRDMDGKPKGVAFNILGNESPKIMRIQTCQISTEAEAAK